MNFVDALRSGKPYRRRGWAAYRPARTPMHSEASICELQSDMLADDWEVVEPTVTINKTQFHDAVAKAQKAEGARGFREYRGGYSFDAFSFIWSEVAKNLGLED